MDEKTLKNIEVFFEKITEKYGVKCGECDNFPDMYHKVLLDACKQNTCGMYGRCHVCPPNTGDGDACIERALSYPKVAAFQKIYPLEDSFDFPGMVEAKKDFVKVVQGVLDEARAHFDDMMLLGAGGCGLCAKCTYEENKPCRFPDRAVASLESYCIQVSELASKVGLKYINGQNTVTYFGAVFIK